MLGWVAACGGDDSGGSTAGGTDTTTSGSGTTTDATATEGSSSAGTSSGSGPTSSDATTDATDSGGSATDGTTTGGSGSAGCGNPSLGPGTHSGIQVDVNGTLREFNLFVPAGYDPNTPAPLVLNFHGLMGSPDGQADFSQFNDTADSRGMLVAYPKGIGDSFNAGACCGDASSQGVDDVGFSRAIVDQLAAQHCVDTKRVYATGMSNGGHMAHYLACEAADVFAAVASVSGVLGVSCNATRPISIIDFHGTSDLIVPYGGAGPTFPPVDDMMQDWAARNGCDTQSMVTVSMGDAECETWPNCDDDVEVTLCTLGAGHCWPSGGTCLFGTKSDAIDASEMIADLFESKTLP